MPQDLGQRLQKCTNRDKYLTMPTVTAADAIIVAAENLTKTLDRDIPQSKASKETIDQFMELFTKNALKYQEENVKRQRVFKASAKRQRVQEEQQQKNEDARKSCQTLEKNKLP